MTKRRASKDGTIIRLPSGSWRAWVSLNGRRLTHTAPTQAAAREWIKEKTSQIESGLTYQASQTTVGTYLDEWLKSKRDTIRTATAEQYNDVARLYLRPRLGNVRLSELTPVMVQRMYDDLRDKGVGARTVQVVNAVLHGCLEQAVRLGLVARNVAAVCIVPKPKAHEMVVWTESQVNQFLVGVQGQRNEILYNLALATGMRRGELLGLMWKDVDWTASTITVQRQSFEPRGGGFVFQEPKTKRGRRSIELGTGMLERLRDQMGRVTLLRRLCPEWTEHDLIFPSTVGTPQGAENMIRDFKQLVSLSGLPALRFHDCRHTAASIMLSHGIPPIIVAGMLGHSLAVLMDRYAHFIPNMQGAAARLMDGITTPIPVGKP